MPTPVAARGHRHPGHAAGAAGSGFAQKIAALGAHARHLSRDRHPAAGDPAAARRARTRSSPTTISPCSFPAMPSSTASPIRRTGRRRCVALAPGPGHRRGARGRRHRRRAHPDDDVRQRRPARAAGIRRASRGKRVVDLSRRAAAASSSATRSRARGARVDYVACYRRARPQSGAAGWPKRFATAASTPSRSRRAKGSTICGRSSTSATRAAWQSCADVRAASAHRGARARARARTSSRRRARRRRAHRRIARMVRRATQENGTDPCRNPTSSSPRRCRRSSTSR